MPGSPNRLRVLNDQAALAFILDAGAVSRAELGRLTGLSKPAVAELLSRLESAGLVEKAGMRSGGPGPAKQMWRVRPAVGYAAAVDVTVDGIRSRLLDLGGTVVAEEREDRLGPDAAAAVAGTVERLLVAGPVPADSLRSVVVGVPAAVDPRTGVLRGAPALPGLLGFDLAAAIEAVLAVPVLVENDVNLMALAALADGAALDDGAAEQARTFAFVWIDEGLGGALVRDGELIRGFTGGAGEIDYVPIPAADGGSGKLGDLLAPTALAALAASTGDGSAQQALASAPPDSPFATEVVRRIAAGLVSIVAVLDPDVVLLGGAYGTDAAARFGAPIRARLAALLETDVSFVADVRPYPVPPDAALSGAARMALGTAREAAFRTGSLPSSTDPLWSSS